MMEEGFAIMLVIVCLIVGMCLGGHINESMFKNDYVEKDYLVKEGVAEYYIGEKYNKEFRLIKRKENND